MQKQPIDGIPKQDPAQCDRSRGLLPETRAGSALRGAGARVALQASLPAGYCQAIYEVPQFSNHHHLTLSHQHKIYEQRTLESQLTQKIY